MYTCSICQIDFAEGDPLCKTKAFLCQCKETICVPCTTVLTLNNVKFLNKLDISQDDSNVPDQNAVLTEKDDAPIRCPYCRKEMLPFLQVFFERGDIYNMLLAIKLHKFLGKSDDVDLFRKKYEEVFELKCPI